MTMSHKKSHYTYKSKKAKYESSYVYLVIKGIRERVFTLTHLKHLSDIKKFSSPQAAVKLGWVKVK